MVDGVSNLRRTSIPEAGGGAVPQGQLGGHPVKIGVGARQRPFAGRAGQKISHFFKAVGAAPTSLKRVIVKHQEARKARKAEKAAIASLQEAAKLHSALKAALPPGAVIDATGAISGKVESTALGVSDFPLYGMRKGLSLSKEIERQYATSAMVDCDALPAGPDGAIQVPKRGYTDLGRIVTQIGDYDSEAHNDKTQEERAARAVGELARVLGDSKQAAMATGLFSQDIARLFVEGYKDENNKPVMLAADLNKAGVTSAFLNRNGDRVDIVSEGLGKVAYDLKPRADGLVDVRMSWNASITGTKDEQNQTHSLPGMDGSPVLFRSAMSFTVDLRGDTLKVVGEAKLSAELEGHMAV